MSGYTQLAHFLRSWANVPNSEMAKAVEIFQPAFVPKETIFLHAGQVPQTIGFRRDGSTIRDKTKVEVQP